jgi:hypothetical protein
MMLIPTGQFVCTECGACSPQGRDFFDTCKKEREAGWIAVTRCLAGTVWVEHFCPRCEEAAKASYDEQESYYADGLDEVPEEMPLPDSSSDTDGARSEAPGDQPGGEASQAASAAQPNEASPSSVDEMKARFKALFDEVEASEKNKPQ